MIIVADFILLFDMAVGIVHVFLLLTAAVFAADGRWIKVERVTLINDAFDQVMQEGLDKYLDVLDPLRLHGLNISSRVLPFCKLHEVEIDGLADMKRVGEVILLKSRDSKKLQVHLEAERVFYAAQSEIRLLGKSTKRTLYGHAASVKAYLEVTYDMESDSLTLDKFSIARLHNLHLHYEGSPIVINQIENLLLRVVSRYLSSAVTFTAEKTFTHRLRQIFSSSDVLKEMMRSL